MNIPNEDIADAVLANFRRLPPDQRREVLQKLVTDLDAPQQLDDSTENNGESESEAGKISGNLIGWLEESLPPTYLATVLRQYLPDFSPDLLVDPQQKALAEQRLSGLSPFVLYELHQNLVGQAKQDQGLTPDEIVEKTWGTIGETDEDILREIIEDEEYCGY